MKQFIKVRDHYHVHEPASDVAYRVNTQRNEFKQWWINEMAITLALIIPGADPIAVTAPNSAFYKAAKDMYYYMREDITHEYWSFQSQPIYTDSSIGIVYIRQTNHRPEIKFYETC